MQEQQKSRSFSSTASRNLGSSLWKFIINRILFFCLVLFVCLPIKLYDVDAPRADFKFGSTHLSLFWLGNDDNGQFDNTDPRKPLMWLSRKICSAKVQNSKVFQSASNIRMYIWQSLHWPIKLSAFHNKWSMQVKNTICNVCHRMADLWSDTWNCLLFTEFKSLTIYVLSGA